MLSNRIYLGEAVHKGTPHPGEHEAIVIQKAWDAVHAVLQISPRVRRNHSAEEMPSLLRGLVFGADGRAMSPSHTRGKRGQIYGYYVSQAVLKGGASDGPAIARVMEGVAVEWSEQRKSPVPAGHAIQDTDTAARP